jgi:hypothetical protein
VAGAKRKLHRVSEVSLGIDALVSAAARLHNARAILRNPRQEGDNLWSRFNGGKKHALWYYRSLVSAFREHGSNELIEELDRVVTEIEESAKCAEDRSNR